MECESPELAGRFFITGPPGRSKMVFLLLLFSHPVMSNSLPFHGLQLARPSYPSPSPRVCPRSCSLHRCHQAISSTDALFSFCPRSFPASGTFPMSHLFPGVHIAIQCLYSLRNGHHHESINTTCHHAIDPLYCFCPLQPSSLVTKFVSIVLFRLFSF